MKEALIELLKKGWAYVLAFIIVGLGFIAVNWLIVCGIVKIITLCFGLKFTWGLGTGVWIIIILLKSILPKTK